MPGGRLTHKDRRIIATGLAEGAGFAEIARRLGRPTSTVSREVARNGGPDAYRADHAQSATGWRARRPRPAAPPPPPAVTAYGRDADAVRAYVEEFAALMVQTGVPRMASRVLAALVTTDSGALTAADLVHRLQVSPASISKAVAYLAGLDLITREQGPRRRERYVIDDDMWFRTWMSSAQTTASLADVSRQGIEVLGAATPAGTRLEEMRRFFAQLSDDMTGGPIEAAVGDVLTVMAALVHAAVPLDAARLASALDWPEARVTEALHDAERLPDVTDPIILHRPTPTTYAFKPRPERLTSAQRRALQ